MKRSRKQVKAETASAAVYMWCNNRHDLTLSALCLIKSVSMWRTVEPTDDYCQQKISDHRLISPRVLAVVR